MRYTRPSGPKEILYIGLFPFFGQEIYGFFVSFETLALDRPDCHRLNIGNLPEILPFVSIRKMHFHSRYFYCPKRIRNGDACVCIRARIDHDSICPAK